MPKPPPHDAEGNVVPHDHEEIETDSVVIRRISELQLCVDKDGRRRISSKAYQGSNDSDGGMSIDIPSFIEEDGKDVAEWVTTPRWIGSVQLSVATLRGRNLLVGYDPLPNKHSDNENPYHGAVWGSFSKAAKKAIAQDAQWFVPIDGVELV